MSFQRIRRVRLSLLPVACLVMGCALITYGLTRWLVTKHIIEAQVARIAAYVESENIEIVSIALCEDGRMLSRSPKPISDIVSRIRRPGYPDYWRPGALIMGGCGVVFICCGCYVAVRASGCISKSGGEHMLTVLAAIILCGILLGYVIAVSSRLWFSCMESAF